MSVQCPEPIEWADQKLTIIDQRRLPDALEYLHLQTLEDVVDAIRTLAVRGAPAIGIAAAYGLVVCTQPEDDEPLADWQARRARCADAIADARPTAVNLRWAIDRLQAVPAASDTGSSWRALVEEAERIHAEDRAQCQAIGEAGVGLIKPGAGVLTHCNAGALAVSQLGTATAPMYLAHARGEAFKVWSCETRPLLQGARLTSWELNRAGVDVTLICDSMAASVMARGAIDLVIVGTDRVTRNGDVVNKIGTLNHAILARHYGIPFFVACPSSTFDAATATGADVPIEERSPEEVRTVRGAQTAAPDIPVHNPAFDVTPAELVTGFITDRGLIEMPCADLAERFG